MYVVVIENPVENTNFIGTFHNVHTLLLSCNVLQIVFGMLYIQQTECLLKLIKQDNNVIFK